MESKSTLRELPVSNYSVPDESPEVRRLVEGETDILGPVVVGGRCGADCFRYPEREVQAGLKDPSWDYVEVGDLDEDGVKPRTRPW